MPNGPFPASSVPAASTGEPAPPATTAATCDCSEHPMAPHMLGEPPCFHAPKCATCFSVHCDGAIGAPCGNDRTPNAPTTAAPLFPEWLNMMPTEEVINLVRGGSALAREYVAYCDQVHRDARKAAADE